jgi:hypothetical protein
MVVEGHRDVLTEVVGPWVELGEGVIHKAIGHPGHADKENKPEEIEKAPDVKQERKLLSYELTECQFAEA